MNTNDLCRIVAVLANLIFENQLEATIYHAILEPTQGKFVMTITPVFPHQKEESHFVKDLV